MSADLFAAFGHDESLDKHSDRQREEQPGLSTAPDVLMKGFETLDIEPPRDLYQLPPAPNQGTDKLLWHQDREGTDILFDATEDASQGDDDFGRFQDVEATRENDEASAAVTRSKQESTGHPMRSATPTHDLLGLDQEHTNPLDSAVTPTPLAISVNTFSTSNTERPAATALPEDDWGDFSTPGITDVALFARHATATTQRVQTQKSEIEQEPNEDDWDAFDNSEPEASNQTQAEGPPSGLAAALSTSMPRVHPPPKWDLLSQSTRISSIEAVRPPNIPPPAILLQLLPGVFTELRQTAIQQAKGLEKTTDLSSQDIAHRVIQAFTVGARIIAGRSLRWKRDAILSQSMRIGPAASAGGGRGMKLAAIDKSESLREEREAADVVGAWEKSAHMFNTTVSKAGIKRPLMAFYLSVRPRLTSGVEVLKASHACALCGINRDERVAQVDVNVEDSFGEYWIDQWGHRDCREVWATYKHRLHQR